MLPYSFFFRSSFFFITRWKCSFSFLTFASTASKKPSLLDIAAALVARLIALHAPLLPFEAPLPDFFFLFFLSLFVSKSDLLVSPPTTPSPSYSTTLDCVPSACPSFKPPPKPSESPAARPASLLPLQASPAFVSPSCGLSYEEPRAFLARAANGLAPPKPLRPPVGGGDSEAAFARGVAPENKDGFGVLGGPNCLERVLGPEAALAFFSPFLPSCFASSCLFFSLCLFSCSSRSAFAPFSFHFFLRSSASFCCRNITIGFCFTSCALLPPSPPSAPPRAPAPAAELARSMACYRLMLPPRLNCGRSENPLPVEWTPLKTRQRLCMALKHVPLRHSQARCDQLHKLLLAAAPAAADTAPRMPIALSDTYRKSLRKLYSAYTSSSELDPITTAVAPPSRLMLYPPSGSICRSTCTASTARRDAKATARE